MRRLVGGLFVAALGLLGCGKPMQPDLLTRATGAVGPTRMNEGTVVNLNDQTDAAVSFYDAGTCCVVPVAIAVQADEDVGYATQFPSGARTALRKSGGAWRGELCFWLSDPVSRYYFQLGYSLADPNADAGTDDGGAVDAGEFLLDYVNRAAPTEGLGAVGEVNVFRPSGASSCAGLDAGVHGQVFDAGVAAQDAGP